MSKSDTSRMESLEALLAEKRKHETYLAKLEERRGSTPASVYNKLRDEYLTKLTDLQVRASMEAESLGEGLKAEEEGVAEVEAKLAAATEERIEGELRAEVGEFDPKDWAERLKGLNATIARIEKDLTARRETFERTRSLLAEARGTGAHVAGAAASPVPAVPAPAAATKAAAESAPSASAAPPPASTRTSGAAAAPASPEARVSAPVASAPAAPVVPPVAPESAARPSGGQPAAESRTSRPASTTEPRASVPVEPQTATPAPAPASPEPAAPRASTPPKGAPISSGPSFDELEFLKSVVGRASTPVKAEPSAPPADAAPRASGGAKVPTPPAPPAVSPAAGAPPKRASTNVRPPENPLDPPSGPLGRPTPRTSQAIKTLKCQECGTLNYPTEWYCERCGGELAAL